VRAISAVMNSIIGSRIRGYLPVRAISAVMNSIIGRSACSGRDNRMSKISGCK
jgi:hypothetical protein